MASFVRALKEFKRHNTAIPGNPERTPHLDEIVVDGVNGRRRKAVLASNINSGSLKTYPFKPGKYVTACFITNLNANVLPLFIFLAPKRTVNHLYHPLPSQNFKDQTDLPHWLTKDVWYPDSALSGILKTDQWQETFTPVLWAIFTVTLNENPRRIKKYFSF